jgi:hypothetical protein
MDVDSRSGASGLRGRGAEIALTRTSCVGVRGARRRPAPLRRPGAGTTAVLDVASDVDGQLGMVVLRAAGAEFLSDPVATSARGSAAMVAPSPRAATRLFDEALDTVGGERWALDHARVQLAYGEHLRRLRQDDPARRHRRPGGSRSASRHGPSGCCGRTSSRSAGPSPRSSSSTP